MPNPSVSIIIPAHNAYKFIYETICSALAQTYQDFEIIVVDDGSTDGTSDLVAQFGNRVKIIKQANGGAAKARNVGIQVAAGEWLAFLDADDLWLSNKLERQLEQASSEYPMVYTDRYNIGVLAGLPHIQSTLQPLYEGDIFLDLLTKGNFVTTSSVLLRTEICRKFGGFCEDDHLLPAEDWDFWLRLAGEHKVRACREPLVKYRLLETGVSRDPSRMNRARVLITQRALASNRGMQLSSKLIRQIWARTWATNGWDAARHGRRYASFKAYAKSLFWVPFEKEAYLGLARLALG
jgi:glycosyltransferase involved in cell wall biosynthesis